MPEADVPAEVMEELGERVIARIKGAVYWVDSKPPKDGLRFMDILLDETRLAVAYRPEAGFGLCGYNPLASVELESPGIIIQDIAKAES